jgi:pycsar effector protein
VEDVCVTATSSPPAAEPPPNPDHAWKALGLVIDWIKHAETKAGATLAATGVTGGALYSLIKDANTPSNWLIASTVLCALAVLGAGLCAGMVLWPRLKMKEDPTSLLYFHHIARGHAASDTYATSLVALTRNMEVLVTEIASQSWANSRVAHDKYMWGGRAIRLLLCALIILAVTAGLRPRLARIYRAYLSELVAIFNGSSLTREVNIAGDAAWAVVNTPSKPNIDTVFAMGYRANSMAKLMNYYMQKADYGLPIKIGVGMSYGRALMIKAGYNGSGINDVVYMGDVVNEAAKLANYGNSQSHIPPLVASEVFRYNLNEKNQGFCNYDHVRGCYTANVVDTAMEEWYQANCT